MNRFVTLIGAMAVAATGLAQGLKDKVNIVEKRGDQVPLDLTFQDEQGKDVKLAQFFDGKKPVILILVFYKCGGTCTKELESAATAFKAIKTWDIGKEYEVVTVSIHPKEGEMLAQMKDDLYAEKYDRPTGKDGWHFLTGDEKSIRKLTDTVGFNFTYDAASDQIQHPNTLVVLTPEGKISQYFNGLTYPARLVLIAMQRAKGGEIGEKDSNDPGGCILTPAGGKYTPAVQNALKIGGGLFLIGLVGSIYTLSKRSRSTAISKEDIQA